MFLALESSFNIDLSFTEMRRHYSIKLKNNINKGSIDKESIKKI